MSLTFPLPVVAETTIAAEPVQTVRGRDVHAFLGIAKDFTNWIKVQIERARLVEGRDFVVETGAEVFAKKGENPEAVAGQGLSRGGRPRAEYHLTLEAAKHVGMMSGTDRGHELREYFLECERKAKAQPPPPLLPAVPRTFPEALRLAADLAETNAQQAAEIAVLAPRSEALAVIADVADSWAIRDCAKLLQTTEKSLRAYLAGNGWIYRRGHGEPWRACANRERQGWMTTKLIPVETTTGRPWTRPQARITPRGVTILAARLNKPLPPEIAAQGNLSLSAPSCG